MTNANISQMPPWFIKVASFFLLSGLFFFPFSIALTNFFFAVLILISVVRWSIFKQGWNICWQQYQQITIGVLLFIGFTIIGSLWGPFNDLAIHKIGKQLNWLVIPAMVGLISMNTNIRKQSFLIISLSLSLNLILCTLQYFGVVHIDALGSAQHDATGFLGHLSFGFVYGIWAGALIVAAQSIPNKIWKLLCYGLVIYAVVTVFLSQGRSGYITTFTCISLVIFKVLYPQQLKLKLLILVLFISLLTGFIAFHEPTKNKLQNTVSGVSAFLDGDWKHVDERIRIWAIAIKVWENNPLIGVGTAGYPKGVEELAASEKYPNLLPPGSSDANTPYFGHPHNEFLFELSRWGPLGLLTLLYLCWHWLRAGWKADWQHDSMTAYLFTATALSVILHGLTEPSLNTQYSTVFATLMLGLAISGHARRHH